MVTVFFGPNRLILIKATQGRYWAAMLGSVPVDASMFCWVPLVPARCLLVPIGAGRCRFRGEIAGTAVFLFPAKYSTIYFHFFSQIKSYIRNYLVKNLFYRFHYKSGSKKFRHFFPNSRPIIKKIPNFMTRHVFF